MSDALLEGLDALVPAETAHGDWDDVLARAGVSRRADERAVARRQTRRVVAIALAVALVVVLAAPALAYLLGWIGRHDVSYSQSKPAPNVVKKQFYDLGQRSPPQFALGVRAGQAREVGRYPVHGRRRKLWVVPTRFGGFCFLFEKAFGGCQARAADRRRFPLAAGWMASSANGPETVAGVEGSISAVNAERLELRFRDGGRTDVPFVFVSKPIAAGFFSYDVPRDRWTPLRRVIALVALDGRGRVIARQAFPYVMRRPVLHVSVRRRPPRGLPSTGVPPTPPLQTAASGGVSVVAGANGSVVFRIGTLDREHRVVLRGMVSYGCFKITHEFGIFDTQGVGTEGRLQPVVAVSRRGAKTPFDGCQIGGEGGHLWPDHFGSHTAVEIPLTAAGRRYFADRAAARDLALFVRTRRVQRLRKEPPAQALRDLRSAYPQLAHSRIRIAPTATGLTFTEGRFRVVVSHRRIVSQNVKPYAFVF